MATPTPALAARVRAGSGENACKCYQCKKCSAGCPVAGFADLHPAQIMRCVQLGDLDTALQSKFIWLCTGCETCTTRCPQDIDIAAVMDELRMIAREDGRVRAEAPFASILELNYRSFRRWGRLYEVELLALDKLKRPKSFLDDVPMGVKMFMKGKISPLPTIGDRGQMKRMAQAADRIVAEKRAKARAKGGAAAPTGLSSAPGPPGGVR